MKRVRISGNDGRGGVSRKYREASERQKKGDIIATTNNHTTATDSNKATCHTALQVKAEVTCIGTSLSTDD
jgi:hypothetical protein